jgi:hypothetical protein
LLLIGPLVQAQTPAWQTAVAAVVGVGSGNSASVTASAADDSGNLYLAGNFTGTVSLGNITLTSAGGYDFFVAKWSIASNRIVWAQRAGGSGYNLAGGDYVTGLAVSGSSIYAVGNFTSTTPSFGSITLTNDSYYYTISGAGVGQYSEAFVTKLTDKGASGEFVWAKKLSGVYEEKALAVAIAGSAVYVSGSFNSAAPKMDNVLLINPSSNGSDSVNNQVFVVKVEDGGATARAVWMQQAGSSSVSNAISAQGNALAVVGSSVYVGGKYTYTIQFGSSALKLSSNSIDGFVAKLADAGATSSFEWAQPIEGSGSEACTALAANSSGIYVAGYFTGSTSQLGTTTLTNAKRSNNDIFVAKLTDAGTSGSFVWAQQAGGSGDEYANTLVALGKQLYLAGSFEATATVGSTSLVAKGKSDIVVAKWLDAGASASFEWAQQAGSEEADAATALACTSAGIYVAGGANAAATFGTQSLNTPSASAVGFLATLGGAPLATLKDKASTISIFPNPAHGSATLQMGAIASFAPVQVSLTTLLGQPIRRYTSRLSATGNATLDLAGLAPGVYLLQGQVDGQVPVAGRLVVE